MQKVKHLNKGRFVRDFVLLIFAVTYLSPLYWMLSLSFKDATQAVSDSWGLPISFHPENYVEAWNRMDIVNLFQNSLIYTVGAMVLCLVCSSMVAYALTRMYMKHNKGLTLYFTLGMLIPSAVLMIPVYQTVMAMNLKGSHLKLILPYAAFSMSSAVLMLCAFFRSIPVEMEEAAAIDGCSVTRCFVSIMVPIIKPAIITQAMFQFISYWNEYGLVSIFATSDKWKTLTLGLDKFFGQFDITNWGVVGAGVALCSLPMIIVYIFCNQQIEQGMVGTSGLK